MIAKTLPLSSLLGASLVLSVAACSKQHKETSATRAEATTGEIRQSESLKATVQEVDQAGRRVTLRDEEGHPFSVDVGDNIDLARIQPNDEVRVTYQESVAFALRNEDAANTSEPAIEQSARRVPDGVQFGRKIDTTVEILAVSEDGSHATFRGPEGGVRTVHVNDSSSQKKIAHLRPGDSVAVTYTEKLALALEAGDRD